MVAAASLWNCHTSMIRTLAVIAFISLCLAVLTVPAARAWLVQKAHNTAGTIFIVAPNTLFIVAPNTHFIVP